MPNQLTRTSGDDLTWQMTKIAALFNVINTFDHQPSHKCLRDAAMDSLEREIYLAQKLALDTCQQIYNHLQRGPLTAERAGDD